MQNMALVAQICAGIEPNYVLARRGEEARRRGVARRGEAWRGVARRGEAAAAAARRGGSRGGATAARAAAPRRLARRRRDLPWLLKPPGGDEGV